MVELARRISNRSITSWLDGAGRIQAGRSLALTRLCMWVLAAIAAAALLLALPRDALAQSEAGGKPTVTIRTVGPRTAVRRAVEKPPVRTQAARRPAAGRKAAAPAKRKPLIASARSKHKRARSRSRRVGEGPVALNNRAYRMQRQGQHKAAEPLLRQALRQRPGYAYALYNLGWSLVEQGRAGEALPPLRKTAALQPERWEPHHRLSQAYRMLGQQENAQAAARRARELRYGRRVGSGARKSRRADSGPGREPRFAVSSAAWIGSTDRAEERLRALAGAPSEHRASPTGAER
jgi:tetratricopeptide (TPR) repeat protein